MIVNGERELAYVVKVTDVKPMNADRLECVQINGWNCVCSKGTFHPGDLGIFFEIDSKLPEVEPFTSMEFLKSKHYKIKSQKIRGVISQGLLLSPEDFGWKKDKYPEGTPLTKELNVTYYIGEDNTRKAKNTDRLKYSTMAQRHKELFKKQPFRWLMRREWGRKILFLFFGKKSDKPLQFPTKFPYVHRSDEERCENIPWILENKNPWIKTTKIDGCLDRGVSVYTDEGPILISDIVNHKLPVKVLTWNEQLQCCEFKPIASYHKWKRVSDMYDIEVHQVGYHNGNKPKHIKCTADHKFYVGNNQYKKASELSKGDTIYHRVINGDAIYEQILLGILLGDGTLDKRYNNIYGGVTFYHSDKQEEYLKETVRLLGVNASIEKNIISGFGSNILRAHCQSTEHFKNIIKTCCVQDGKKYVTKAWCDLLTPVSLAFWYMDDGSIVNTDNKLLPRIRLATNGFTEEECTNLINALENKFGIKSKLFNAESYKGNTIVIDAANTDKFIMLVAPFICDSMKYKIPQNRRNVLYSLKDYVCTNYDTITAIDIKSISKIKDYNKKYVFDLTIDSENSNYFANGVLTHNTSSTYILERKKFGKYEYYVCSRNVRQKTRDQKNYHSDMGNESNVYWDMSDKYHIEEFLKAMLKLHPEWNYVCLQGETAGQNLQGNPHKFPDVRFFGFNFIDSVNGRWNSVEARDLCAQYEIPWVPIVDENYILPDDFEEFKLSADGPCEAPDAKGLREGYVYRSLDGKTSFKNVSREYLIKKGE